MLLETVINGNSLEVTESTSKDPYSVFIKMSGGKCVLSLKADSIKRAKLRILSGVLSETLINGDSLEVRESTAPHPYSVFNKMPGGKCLLSFIGDSVKRAKLGESLVYKVSGGSACGFCFMFSEWRFDDDKWDRFQERGIIKEIRVQKI
ncbi:hypothetical protein CEXT_589871 [Caerostris extrusa]|uniref:Uncharacterized protein n=1 Tax=Caerostris extrusa TaxID=172846 RepID=A0AAV4QJB3_CAEEX|nr:hypothetical protein CEXT_589871 [Caerostris extrusa]